MWANPIQSIFINQKCMQVAHKLYSWRYCCVVRRFFTAFIHPSYYFRCVFCFKSFRITFGLCTDCNWSCEPCLCFCWFSKCHFMCDSFFFFAFSLQSFAFFSVSLCFFYCHAANMICKCNHYLDRKICWRVSFENRSIFALDFHCRVCSFIKSSRMCQFTWESLFFSFAFVFVCSWLPHSRLKRRWTWNVSYPSHQIKWSQTRNFNKLHETINSSRNNNETYMSSETRKKII